MRVTLKDIVEKTGVSKSVISMYLNKDPRVRLSEEKKKRIDSAVQELGYRPSFAACTLRKGRSRTLGLVLGGITNAYFSHLAEAALKYADDRGYQLLLSLTSWDPEKERRSLNNLIERQVDGILYSPHLQPDPDYSRQIRETGIPVLLVRQEIDGFLSVKTNWDEIFEDVAAFFAERGHRKIMYSAYFSDNRNEQFREKCRKLGLESVPFLIGPAPETDLFQAILAEHPDALFISDCRIVEQFLLWFRKQDNGRCPEIVTHYNFPIDLIEDPAVVGIVYEDFYRFVKNAINLLIDSIETKNTSLSRNMSHIRYFHPVDEFIKQKDRLVDTLDKAEEQEKMKKTTFPLNNVEEHEKKMKRKPFTLVELLIVVAVIAILVGLLLPALGKARQTTIAISCLNNVKQCMLGIQSYGNDYNGIFNTCENQSTSTGAGYGAWARLLTVNSYLPPSVVYCPLLRAEKTDTSRIKTLGVMMAQNGWTKVWLEKPKIQNLFGNEIYYRRDPYFGYDLLRIKTPSRFPLLADTCSVNSDTGEKTGNRQFCPGTDTGDYKLSLHHRNTASTGFPDGHAERLGLSWFRTMQFKTVLYDYRPLNLQ